MALSSPQGTNFGETPLASTKVRGAERLLTITEHQRVGTSFSPTGVQFKFSRENFTGPRGPQTFGLQLRTSRTDLPGSETPVEQVLGWNYTPFTVTGVWDDRHAGVNYAETTRRDFEAMVKRGNMVKYEFEQVAMFGLITNLTINYQRKDRQGYSFTISPHFRYDGESVRANPNPNRKVVNDPKTSVAKSRAALQKMQDDQALARAKNAAQVQQLLSSSIFADINSGIDDVAVAITSAENTVNNEILKPGQDAVNALNRGAQTMATAKTALSSVLSTTQSIASGSHMATTSMVETLKFENWHRSVSASTRATIVAVEQTRQDLAFRARPKPKRLHRARQGESLYAISNLYYGTPHNWRSILTVNHLSSIILTGGELLEIPEIKV